MKTKHTTGKWRVSENTNSGAAWTVESESGFICDGWGPGSSIDDANARIIAAAPELLEALQWAADFAEGSRDANEKLNNPKFNEWLATCRAAIAKATGGPL